MMTAPSKQPTITLEKMEVTLILDNNDSYES
jgi:hypothetical protein